MKYLKLLYIVHTYKAEHQLTQRGCRVHPSDRNSNSQVEATDSISIGCRQQDLLWNLLSKTDSNSYRPDAARRLSITASVSLSVKQISNEPHFGCSGKACWHVVHCENVIRMICLCTYCLPLGPAFRCNEDTQRKGCRQRSSGTTEFHVTLLYNISAQNVSPAEVKRHHQLFWTDTGSFPFRKGS